jgi:hypothetical protein
MKQDVSGGEKELGVSKLQMRRPREVEKGSRTAAAGLALMAGLYIIAAWVNVNSRISNIVDTVLEKDISTMKSDFNSKFGRERARVDTYEDDGGRRKLASYPDAKGDHACALNSLLLKIKIHGRTDSLLPKCVKRVHTKYQEESAPCVP